MRYVKRDELNKPKHKNSKKKKLLASFIGILALCGIAVCILLPFLNRGTTPSLYDEGYVYEGNGLLGIWREEYYDEYYYQTYFFDNDGNVTLSSYYYGIKEASVDGKYSVSDKNLITITYNEGTNQEKTEENRFCILGDGRLVMKTLGNNGEVELVMTKDSTRYNKDLAIFGSWSADINGKKTTYTFNNDYTGQVLDQTGAKDTFVYSTTENNLYWIYTITYKDTPPIFSGDILPYTYEISGSTLTLTVSSGDNTISYELTKE